jgi:hypothetical protein
VKKVRKSNRGVRLTKANMFTSKTPRQTPLNDERTQTMKDRKVSWSCYRRHSRRGGWVRRVRKVNGVDEFCTHA